MCLQLLRLPYKALKILPRIVHIQSFCYEKSLENRFLIYISYFYVGGPCKTTPKVDPDLICEDERHQQRNADTSTNEAGIIAGIAMNLDW
jgi:hypothetical protein